MEAFPRVLREVPNARLIVAGANHHTKPGYWESIREAQRRELRASSSAATWPEDDIPELLSHDQHCGDALRLGHRIERPGPSGLRVRSADRLRRHSRFSRGWPRTRIWPSASTRAGDAADLADKLIAILQSPEQQRQLAHHNFSAAMRMTMPSVVRHYLRWFELSRHKQTMSGLVRFPLLHSRRSLSRLSAILQSGFPIFMELDFAIPRRMASGRSVRRERLDPAMHDPPMHDQRFAQPDADLPKNVE